MSELQTVGANVPDIVRQLIKSCNAMKEPSLTAFLPLLRFEGHPYSLKYHFQLEPLYKLKIPRRMVLMTGRQVGKSQGLVSSTILRCALVPNYHTLICEPQFMQIRQISNITFKNMVAQSYISNYMIGPNCNNSMLIREFTSGSRTNFMYIGGGADRARGLAGVRRLTLDEADDMEVDVINIVAETMSAVKEGGTYLFTGTPKLTDGTLPYYYNMSSGGEITIKCEHCNKINIASVEYDLLKMIGKTTCICAKCGKPLDVRKSYYSFRRPHLRSSFDGFHMSQVTHPLHCTSPVKWREFLLKMENYPKSQAYNELLGEPCDEAVRLITRGDLEAATTGLDNDIEVALRNHQHYGQLVLGIDWGGYGIEGESFTVMAVVGLRPMERKLEVLYLEKIPTGKKHEEQVARAVSLAEEFHCTAIAHDGTGAGAIKEEMLNQEMKGEGILTVPLVYMWAPRQDALRYMEPNNGHAGYYALDKTRSLALTIGAIKAKQLLLPNYKSCSNLLDDFLALGEDIRSTQNSGEIRIITRMGTHPDDTAHAINLAANALWHMNKCRPDLGSMVNKYENQPDWASEGSEMQL